MVESNSLSSRSSPARMSRDAMDAKRQGGSAVFLATCKGKPAPSPALFAFKDVLWLSACTVVVCNEKMGGRSRPGLRQGI